MAIKSFSPFGYEGSIVTVEVDIRRGIPAVDIVGLADGAVKEARERMRSAISNSGFGFPPERVLVSLSPADLKKEGSGFDLAIALAVLEAQDRGKADEDTVLKDDVLVMGELGLGGDVRPLRAVNAALQTAHRHGIGYAIVPYAEKWGTLNIPRGMKVAAVADLHDAYRRMNGICNGDLSDFMESTGKEEGFKVEFHEMEEGETPLDEIKGNNFLKYAMAVAAAGRHNLIAWGAPGCGKTRTLQRMYQLMPKLMPEEAQSVDRIYSLAGLGGVKKSHARPFRMPHQTASIEGMCGGGAALRPGEISLAHHGVLFLDEAAEFRSAVLQMLRVPLENGSIALSRAGRDMVYPAKFQLVMATSPCPCGFLGSKGRMCLCSMRAVENYWRKFSAPLLDRGGIRVNCGDEAEFPEHTLEELRAMVRTAWERQHERQGKLNHDLDIREEDAITIADDAMMTLLVAIDRRNLTARGEASEIKKIARTVADMDGRDEVSEHDMEMALTLHGKLPVDFE